MAKRKRTALQTDNIREYRRLRKNIIARMKYREKQGFKVDYTTKPEIKRTATKRDIERLQNYKVGLNQYGEVIADKPRSKSFVKTDFKGTTPSQVYNQTTAPDMGATRIENTGLDYIGMVSGALLDIRDKAFNLTTDEIGHPINQDVYDELILAYERVYNRLADTLNEQEMEHGEDKLNEYYKSSFSRIATAIASMVDNPPSDAEQLEQEGDDLQELLIVS